MIFIESLKIFKIFFFVKNLCYFFGVAGDESTAEKDLSARSLRK